MKSCSKVLTESWRRLFINKREINLRFFSDASLSKSRSDEYFLSQSGCQFSRERNFSDIPIDFSKIRSTSSSHFFPLMKENHVSYSSRPVFSLDYGKSLFSRSFSHSEIPKGAETINVTFVNKNGEEKTISVPEGQSMLEAAHDNDIDLEGACEGSLACSTCHVIIMDEDYYKKLPESTDEENDMLDLAFGLTETSRLGCQVIAKKDLNGLRLALPAATRNFAVDGYKPKPH